MKKTKKGTMPLLTDVAVKEIVTPDLYADGLNINGDVIFEVQFSDPHKITYFGDGNPSFEIVKLEKIIIQLKKTGATRVMINFHEDHGEYHFTGIKRTAVDAVAAKSIEIANLQTEMVEIKGHKDGYDNMALALQKKIDVIENRIETLRKK